jgi:hypothetical protein
MFEVTGGAMAKTITLRVEDETFSIIKTAAGGVRRTISNFLEVAALAYIAEESSVSDAEMIEIIRDKHLANKLRLGRKQIKKGGHTIVG